MVKGQSDLVRDSKLESTVSSKRTVHVKHVSNPVTGQRRIRVEEVWERARELGQGGSGIVWQERCTSGPNVGEVRAVKCIPKGIATAKGASPVMYYERELEAIAKFSQKRYRDHFVRAYGWYETDNTVFIAMEYIPQGDLHGFLDKPLSDFEACQITQQVLEGLRYMHENDFAHRDLKPANILIQRPGPSWWVKIADFGIAKRIVDNTMLRTRTGTDPYLAPEVKGIFSMDTTQQDLETYSLAVDIWSVGVIAFQMTTSDWPFANQMALFNYIVRNSSLPLNKSISPACADFVQAAMARLPGDRPTAIEALSSVWLQQISQTLTAQEVSSRVGLYVTQGSDTTKYSDSTRHSAQWTISVASPSQSAPVSPSVPEPVSRETAPKPTITAIVLPIRQQTEPSEGPASYSIATGTVDQSERSGSDHASVQTQTTNISSEPPRFQHHQILGPDTAFMPMCFSEDSRRIAYTTYNGDVVLWELNDCDGQFIVAHRLRTIDGKKPKSLAFTPDKTKLAVGCESGYLQLWNLELEPREVPSLEAEYKSGFELDVDCVALSPNGNIIAMASGQDICVYKFSHKGVLEHLQSYSLAEGVIRMLTFSPDGSRLVVSAILTAIIYFDVDSDGQLLGPHRISISNVLCSSALQSNGRNFVTGGHEIIYWKVDGKRLFRRVQTMILENKDSRHIAESVAISLDGRRIGACLLMVGERNGHHEIIIWEADQQGKFHEVQRLDSQTFCPILSPDCCLAFITDPIGRCTRLYKASKRAIEM